MKCSYCHRRVPNEVDKQKVAPGDDVCFCDHNWLHLSRGKRPTPRTMPMLSLPAKPKDASE